MLDSLPVALLVGTALGFLSGLGIGGGSLLILWLTFILNMDPHTARTVNLLFFIPSAVIVCFLRVKSGSLKIRSLIPAMIAGCIAAAVFSWLSTAVDVQILKKAFGAVLVFSGARELFYRQKEKGSPG